RHPRGVRPVRAEYPAATGAMSRPRERGTDMGSSRRRIVALVAMTGFLTGGVAFDARAWDSSPLNPVSVTKPAPTADRPFGYDCGANDNAEYLDIDSNDNRTP